MAKKANTQRKRTTPEQRAAADNVVRIRDRLSMDVLTLTGTATVLAGIDFAPLAEFKDLNGPGTNQSRDYMAKDIREAAELVRRVADRLKPAVEAAKEIEACEPEDQKP